MGRAFFRAIDCKRRGPEWVGEGGRSVQAGPCANGHDGRTILIRQNEAHDRSQAEDQCDHDHTVRKAEPGFTSALGGGDCGGNEASFSNACFENCFHANDESISHAKERPWHEITLKYSKGSDGRTLAYQLLFDVS